ncbi:hypothetical protein AB6A40_004360 [Gnathostoma spinigerum]|uniref:Uncharacterized protein n=1 Tax=Gnathostoma spinigerum TaxID=75299 RepID=A0ABD6EJQ7_9BILA
MRITLNKNKLVPAQKSLSLSCPIAECSASSTAVSSPESNVVETSVLPPQKIPKLTIRFGGPKVDPMLIQSSSKQRLSPSFPPQNHVVMKSFQCGNSVLSPQLSVSSYNCTEDIDDVEAATSVQFSPESERSTEDDTEQLRAQTDDALSRLNSSGWDSNDSKLPLRNPADVFSRLVGSSPLMNPLIEFSSVRSLIPPLPPASSWVLDTSRAETRTATSTVIAPPWCPLLSKSTTLIRQATTVQSSNRSATSRSSQYDGSPASN